MEKSKPKTRYLVVVKTPKGNLSFETVAEYGALAFMKIYSELTEEQVKTLTGFQVIPLAQEGIKVE